LFRSCHFIRFRAASLCRRALFFDVFATFRHYFHDYFRPFSPLHFRLVSHYFASIYFRFAFTPCRSMPARLPMIIDAIASRRRWSPPPPPLSLPPHCMPRIRHAATPSADTSAANSGNAQPVSEGYQRVTKQHDTPKVFVSPMCRHFRFNEAAAQKRRCQRQQEGSRVVLRFRRLPPAADTRHFTIRARQRHHRRLFHPAAAILIDAPPPRMHTPLLSCATPFSAAARQSAARRRAASAADARADTPVAACYFHADY